MCTGLLQLVLIHNVRSILPPRYQFSRRLEIVDWTRISLDADGYRAILVPQRERAT
jgi:hypothetical protein